VHKILLVDDDKGIIEVIKNVLIGQNYEVIAAYDGKEGLQKVQNENPDLIVLDIRMPSMNGYEFIRTLREERSGAGKPMLPVIVLTAKEKMEEIFKLEGAKGYLNNSAESTTGKAPYPPKPRTASGLISFNDRNALMVALTIAISEPSDSPDNANTKPFAWRSS